MPLNVTRNTHNASTFAPYDPSEAIGDLSPTAPNPKPEEGKQCGVVGQIILVAVAAVASYYTFGLAQGALGALFGGGGGATGLGAATANAVGTAVSGVSAAAGSAGGFASLGAAAASAAATAAGASAGTFSLTGLAAGAISGAAGSLASQGLAMATGYQDQLSWNQVGLAALSGGLGANAGQPGGLWDAARQGAVSSVQRQGIAMLTGLQSEFDWTGLATGAVGGAVNYRTQGWGWNNTASSTASAIANAATCTALDGGSFEQNLRAAIPDVIGSAIGNAITRGISAQIAEAKEDAAKEADGGVVERTLSYVEAVDMVLNPNEFALDNSETFALMEQAKFRVNELQGFDLEKLKGDIEYLNDTRDAMATLTNYYRSSQQNWRDIQDRVDVALYGDAERRLEKVTVSLTPLERNLLIDQARMRRTEQNLRKGTLGAAASWSHSELAYGSMMMVPGAVYGTGKDLVNASVSLADFGVRDLGGTALHGGVIGLNTLTGLQVDSPFDQSLRDVQNAGQTALVVGGAILNDPLGVVNEVRYASLLESEMAFRDGRFLDGWAAKPERIIAELFAPGGFATKLGKGKTVAKVVGETADVAEFGAVGGKVTGPWSRGVTNVVEDGVFTQCANGSCVSATGQILTDGAVSERQLLGALGEWTTPEALATELNRLNPSAGWKGTMFGGDADALIMANSGRSGLVLYGRGAPMHMVTVEPVAGSSGVFKVYDTGAGATYHVDEAWINEFGAGGVWKK